MLVQGTDVTYRYFHTPELTAHLAGHLQGDLCGHAHQHLRSAQCASQYTLTGNGELHTEVLFHLVILVLPVARKNNHHLSNNNKKKLFSTQGCWTEQKSKMTLN